MHAKSSKPPTTFQWDAVDTSPDIWGQNVLRTVEMAIRHKRRTTRTASERESLLSLVYFHLRSKIFSGPLGRSATGKSQCYGH